MLESQTGNADPDAPIRATDNDAAIARLSAVQKGYLIDHYIAPLVPRAHLHQPRSPLINIGTYLRARGIDDLLENWFRLTGERKVQIVSLGAGSDTRFWRLAVRICFFYIRKQEKEKRIDIVSQNGPRAGQLHRYIEIDFAENTSRKAMSIRKSRVLKAGLGNPDTISVGQLSFLLCFFAKSSYMVLAGGGGTTLRAPVYNLFPVDLRTPPATSLATLLGSGDEPLLSPAHPTLLLFECVLAYMNPTASNALIQWFVDYFSAPGGGLLGGIVYEMFKLNDAFGRVMLNNLKVNVFSFVYCLI
jgi:[phosphatase 2A protein]-leucine-carboxy methyltransferase